MKITGITRVKGTRYRVEVDGEYWNILDAEVLADFGFQPGLEVGEEALARALEQAERRRGTFRVIAGGGDFLGVIAGTALILVLLAVLISLVNWVCSDMVQSFDLLQMRM